MPFRFFSFTVLIAVGAILGHLYLYRRLTRELVRSRALRLLALAALILLTLLMMLRRTLQRSLPEELAAAVAVASYAWMGLALCLVVTLLVVDLGRGLVALARWLRARTASTPREPPRVDEGRRRLLARAVAGSAFAAGGGMAA